MKFNPSNTDHIGIEFKVWAPHLTRVTKKLFLLGSLKELGAWDVDKAIQAYPTTDMHTWNVEVSVPAMSQFEWAWLTTNLNRTGVDWEKTTKRSRTVDCFSGTLHTIYGDGEEVFLQTATCLEVTTYMRVEEGLTMVLTGSTPSTGEWDLHFAKQATEFPQRSGYWKVHVTFDALTNLEFKWAVVKEKDHGVLYVQEKLPHSIFGRKSWLRAVAPWNTSLVIVVDTSLLCDLPDTMLGRTEIIVKERKRRGQEIKSWLVKAESGKGTPVRSPRPPPSPVERLTSTAPLSVQIQPTRISLPVTPSLASSVTSLTHVPSVQRTLDLDEHVRQRQDSLSKLERLTQQLSKVYTEENTVYAIKGMGQTELATDKLNSDITNQVPILEGGVTLLMYSKPEYWTEPFDVVSGHATPVLERKASLRSKSVIGSRGSSVDVTEIQEEVEEKSSSLSVQQFLKTLLSADTLLSGVDIIKRKFTDIGQLSGYDRAPPPQQSAVPLIEKEIRLITSYPPPTFSMLQEQAEEVTRHPVISTPRRKITITRVYTPQGSKPRTPPEPASLFEKFKQKSQESFLTEKASSYRGPFSPSRGQSSPSLPSSVGVDDILKSPRDVKDEQINRRLWDKMRERASKEEEEKRNKQKMP